MKPCRPSKNDKKNQRKQECRRESENAQSTAAHESVKVVPFGHPREIARSTSASEAGRADDRAAMAARTMDFAGHVPPAEIADVAISHIRKTTGREIC